MSKYIANLLTGRLEKYNMISKQDKENYNYTILLIIEQLVGFSSLLIIAIIMKVGFPTTIFIIFFSNIRKYTGGFHAKSFGGCLFGTMGIYLAYVVILYPFFRKHMAVNFSIFIIAVLIVMKIGAINHPNVNWNEKEYEACKRKGKNVVILEACCIVIFSILRVADKYCLFMSFGVILSAVLLVLGKFMGQEVHR